MTDSKRLTIQTNSTALVVIDMQNDYCNRGFYMDKAGFDTERLRRPIKPIAEVLSIARINGMLIIFTRQYRTSDELETAAAEGGFPLTALKGEAGWEIVPELAPQPNETILDKTTCSAFVTTNIDELLRSKGINTVIFCGNTLDVCVHSTLRSANDLGYKCITLGDCCGAVNDELHKWSLESIQIEGGVFGSVYNAQDFIGASWET
ncbi:cysteine hydrolase [Candidatus Saccharibacteria bacterium]|nr:cysteine hydrolase [Candidatus Saccharibacteria bacterium]